jgi:hypothetical protein
MSGVGTSRPARFEGRLYMTAEEFAEREQQVEQTVERSENDAGAPPCGS